MASGQQETARIIWRDQTVPVSEQFDDPYFSLSGGLAETQHVFLNGNDLPARFAPGFHVAELGFGTGLNMLVTWKLWRETGQKGPLRFTSFEAFPMAVQDMRAALAAFPELASLTDWFLEGWRADQPEFIADDLHLKVIIGDANETLPRWQGHADAWFLDGFSPAKNPELWRPDLMAAVAGHTNPNGTLATYSAAGHVRKSLADVGFTVDRVPGFGRKRHMTTGIRKTST